MSFGSLSEPGPGFFPRVVGIGLIVMSALTCVEAIVTRSVAGPLHWPAGKARRKVVLLLVSMAAYVMLLPVLGQYIAAGAFFVFALRVLAELPWLKAVAFGLAMGVAVSAFFMELLGVLLPTGLLFD